MAASAQPGPLSIVGINPTLVGPQPFIGGRATYKDSNSDASPMLVWAGYGVRDPRCMIEVGSGANVAGRYLNQDAGWFQGSAGLIVCDAAPATKGAANIVAAAATVAGTPMTLAGASTGITVLAADFMVPSTNLVIRAGSRVIDGLTAYTATSFAVLDPASGVARAVSVTANAAATGGAITITGTDLYGVPLVENIVSVAASTVNGKKAFKSIRSVVPSMTDAGHTYSVGTTDIIGLGLRLDSPAYANVWWDTALATTTFVAAVTTTATALTGDVRGTFLPGTVPDGTKRLVIQIAPTVAQVVANCANWASVTAGLLGVPQFGG